MTNEAEIQALDIRLEQHRAETAAHREAEQYERREMKGFFNALNENMIHLTAAVTEWKTRDAMFEKTQQEQKDEIKDLTIRLQKMELRMVSLESTSAVNTKAKDRVTEFALKIGALILSLAIVGGLAYKLAGGQ